MLLVSTSVSKAVHDACRRIEAATKRLAVAWLLAGLCLVGHAAHWLPHAPHWLHVLGSPPLHALASVLALAGVPLYDSLHAWLHDSIISGPPLPWAPLTRDCRLFTAGSNPLKPTH